MKPRLIDLRFLNYRNKRGLLGQVAANLLVDTARYALLPSRLRLWRDEAGEDDFSSSRKYPSGTCRVLKRGLQRRDLPSPKKKETLRRLQLFARGVRLSNPFSF